MWDRNMHFPVPAATGGNSRIMSTSLDIHGREVIGIVHSHPGGIWANSLSRLVSERFGAAARFRTSMGAGLDLDELMVYLEARDKIRVTGDMVFPGGRPARAH